MQKAQLGPVALILLIILQGGSDYSIFFGHLLARFDGVVATREDVRFPPWTHFHAIRYTIRQDDGRERTYIADPIEGGRGGFPIGTRLRKDRWRLEYEAGGRATDDFPAALYGLWVIVNTGLMLGAIVLAIMIHNRDRNARENEAAFDRAERRLERGDDLPP
jgi:hypothetical protein